MSSDKNSEKGLTGAIITEPEISEQNEKQRLTMALHHYL